MSGSLKPKNYIPITYIEHTLQHEQSNVCEAYVIPVLFGLFFAVCHPYIDVHFVEMLFCDLLYVGTS